MKTSTNLFFQAFLSLTVLFFGLSSLGSAQSVDLVSYNVSPQNGTCLSSGSITISFPNPSPGIYEDWTAQLAIEGSSAQPQTMSVPSDGSDIVFSNLTANSYNILLTNGFSTLEYSSNPVKITSSYITMSSNATSTAPSCNSTWTNYTNDGTITLNVPLGGIGPFKYTVTSPTPEIGVKTATSSARSQSFSGMKGGETISYSIEDMGCSAIITGSHLLASNSSTPLGYSIRGFNFVRDCNDCDVPKFYVNLSASTVNIGNRLSILQIPGNSTITIGSQTFNLTYVGTISHGDHRFTYDPNLVGGPNLSHGMSITTKFKWGCDELITNSTVRMDDNFLNVFSNPIVDNATCAVKYKITMIGDQDGSGGQRNIYFCPTNTLTIEKRDPINTSIFTVIHTGSLPVASLAQPAPSAATSFEVADPGVYRVTASDACHTVQKIIAINSGIPIEAVTGSVMGSILEGTRGIFITGLNSLKYPFNLKIEREDGQSSVSFNSSHPYDLASSYSVNFPLELSYASNPTHIRVIDLPLGRYKLTYGDGCSESTGKIKTQILDLSGGAGYNPEVSVTAGCINSNSIAFDLKANAAAIGPGSVELRLRNSDGSIGSLVQSLSTFKGTFNNIPSGEFILRFLPNFGGYSAGRDINSSIYSYQTNVDVPEYENIDVETSTVFCNPNDSNSGIVGAQVVSGNLTYPLTMALYSQSDPNNPIQGPVNIVSPAKSHIFTGVAAGNYFIRTTSVCYSLDKSFSISTAFTPPRAKVADSTVCPGSPSTLAAINATDGLYDITWLIKNPDNSETIVGSGMPVTLTPFETTVYTARFKLKEQFGCSNATSIDSDVTIFVTDNPNLSTPKVTDIDICNNSNSTVTISNTESGFTYEVLTTQGKSFSPKITGLGNGGDLVLSLPLTQLTAGTTHTISSTNGNAGCKGILEDKISIIQSTSNLSIDVEGSFICDGSNGFVKIKAAENGVTYTILKNGLALSPSIAETGIGSDLNFTIPAAELTAASNEFSILASGASCASGILIKKAVVTIQQRPSVSSSVDAVCGQNGGKGTIRASTFGGSGNYNYSLDNLSWQDEDTFSVDPGTYTVYAKDKITDCVTSSSVTIALYCLEVSKVSTTNPNSYEAIGDMLFYDIVVKNSGTVSISNVLVEDPLTGLNETIATLAPNEDETFSTSYSVRLEDLGKSEIINTARAGFNYKSEILSFSDDAIVQSGFKIDGLNCTGNRYSMPNEMNINFLVEVPYSGGIAASYPKGQPINLGNGTLTATLQAGTINPAGGTLVYQLEGTPINSNPVILQVYFGGQSCNVRILIYEPIQSVQSFSVYPFNDKNNNCFKDSGEDAERIPESGIFIKIFDLNNNFLYTAEISAGQFDVVDLNMDSDLIYYYILDTNDDGSDNTPDLPLGWSSGMSDPNLLRYFQFDGTEILFNTTANPNISDISWKKSTDIFVCLSQDLGSITELDCDQVAFSDGLSQGKETEGLSFTVDYNGGNNGYYEAQEIVSKGIEGLTASLEAGSFELGSGSLIFSIKGIPAQGGIGKFELTIGGQNCDIEFFVVAKADRLPSVIIIKESVQSGYTAVGNVLNYNIKVKNSGNVTLINLLVRDPLTGMSEIISQLAPNEEKILTTSYTVSHSDLNKESVYNEAIVDFQDNGKSYSSKAFVEVDYLGEKRSILAKEDDFLSHSIFAGATRFVGNVLANDLLDGELVDPSKLNITIIDNGGVEGIEIDQFGNLLIPENVIPGLYVVTYSICDLRSPVICSKTKVYFEIQEGKNLKITKTSNGEKYFEGEEIIYSLEIENTSDLVADNVVVIDLLPKGLQFISSQLATGEPIIPVLEGEKITWKFEKLDPKSSLKILLKVKVKSMEQEVETIIINTAQVESTGFEANKVDNTSSVSITVYPFFIPNVITPNGDNFNQNFVINGLGKFVTNHIVIFNRYGDHVFETSSYKNDWSAFGLGSGTYFYILKTSDELKKEHVFKGWIQAIK